MHEEASKDFLERVYRPFSVTLVSRQFGGLNRLWQLPEIRNTYRGSGFEDVIGLMARDGRQTAVASIPLAPSHARSHREPLLRQMRRHLQAGFMNLQQRSLRIGELVCDGGGRILDARGRPPDSLSRELLVAAVRAHDAERRGMVPDADAERVWSELWAGGWALLDSVDSDGKRLLLLRRDPSNPRSRALDARERLALDLVARGAAYKVVASELGTSLSTASEVTERAIRKLGFKSRADFVQRAGGRGAGGTRRHLAGCF
jgi:DNA-binding CsgD family transcriptional regulator